MMSIHESQFEPEKNPSLCALRTLTLGVPFRSAAVAFFQQCLGQASLNSMLLTCSC